MSDPVPVIATIVAGIIGGIGLAWSRRAARKAGIGSNQAQAIADLQLLADTRLELLTIERDSRMRAELALVDFKAQQAIERELAAQCRSDLDDARSENRLLRRRTGEA